jgi:O-antigen/teichoic acid export membrane protein
MIVGILLAFIIPGLLGPEEYGYYSLFTLYISYAGFFILGYCDGFYLEYGGISYQAIDKKKFNSFFYILFLYLIILILIGVFLLGQFQMTGYRRNMLLLVLVTSLLSNINSYFVLLNQATSRFSIYAIGNIIEKVILSIGAIIAFSINLRNSLYFIWLIIIGKLLTSVFFSYSSREIIIRKPNITKEDIKEGFYNIKVGFLLTLSGVGSMLMTGIGRFSIERVLGIEALGYYSFMFSVSVLFTQILSAVGIVLYPMLRKYENADIKNIVNKLDHLIMFISGIILLAYYPGRFLLEILFPEYKPGMDALLFLFPIVICQSRRLLVYDMVYKVLRMERQLLRNVLFSIVFCLLITVVAVQFFASIEMVAATTYVSFFIWNTMTIMVYNRKSSSDEKIFGKDLWLSLGYIFIYFIFGYTLKGFIISAAFIIISYILDYKRAQNLIEEWKIIARRQK